ncbi:MAG: phosphogluconate dehydratase [Rhizobiaceae bacterium]|nr:phosphogluconate dehydratase [Hyphomicrobiales bacterium]NRB31859.1 phosphogluconate dehydratase [Rhizobiaceae bacterium]
MTIAAITAVTERIIERSKPSREAYLDRVRSAAESGPHRSALSCTNLVHGFAACSSGDKSALAGDVVPNLAIITSFNDMLSAHQPFETYPEQIKAAAREAGGVAQVASGVPAMCDGVTQGQKGMELSLFSRDIIAMATAVGLSHNMFDAALYLGVCDKIVPGLMIGALTFGHLPAVFVPAGPMPSGLPNSEKVKVRQLYAEGKVGRDALMEAESASYHSPGTCTFYGTANSNQMLMEFMGLHLPGSSFINPGTPLRDALTEEATRRALQITSLGNEFTPVGEMIDEKAIVNAVIGLHTTGGSTNHVLHLVAIAKAAGIVLTLEDMGELAECTPLLARVYPNGMADVNQFHAAGGLPYVIGELLRAGHLHEDVMTISGKGLANQAKEPKLLDGKLVWEDAPKKPANEKVLSTADAPFSKDGGLKVLNGNIGRAVIKISAVRPQHHVIEAPVRIFETQNGIREAFEADELNMDVIAVCRFQGPRSNGMPELHKLTPPLGVLQDRGYKVALITDGRMSGASGKVPAAIHVSPEAVDGGGIAKLRDGDMVRLDATTGELTALVDEEEWANRELATADLSGNQFGMGVELLTAMRANVSSADTGASVI